MKRINLLSILIIFSLAQTIQAQPNTEHQKLCPDDLAMGDSFGWSVSIDGDHAIVGAVGDNSIAGAAYIYKKEGDSWQTVKKIFASDASSDDHFGQSVCILGDLAVVGATTANYSLGAAYVFQKDEGGSDNWGEVAIIDYEIYSADYFGNAVGISDDFIFVAAKNYDYSRGAVFVYENNGSTWELHSTLTSSDAQPIDNFGFSLDVSEDHLIVGSWLADLPGAVDAGAAYVFKYESDAWTEVKKLEAQYPEEDDDFGWDCAIHEDLIIVSATWDDDMGDHTGAAYIFQRDEGGINNWGQHAKIVASDGGEGDQLGFSVAINQDYAVATAHAEDLNGNNSGAGYLYARNQGGINAWGEIAKLEPADNGEDDMFGYSADMSEGILLIGAAYDQVYGLQSGSAYIFGPGTVCQPVYTIGCTGGYGLENFEVAEIQNLNSGCGDLNGLGYSQYLDLGPANLQQDGTYDFSFSSGSYDDNYFSVWIDFNDDLEFSSDEKVIDNYQLDASNIETEQVTIPADAPLGQHLMRARLNHNELCNDPCEEVTYGETEDYYVNILSSCLPLYTYGCVNGDGFEDFILNEIDNSNSGCENLNGSGYSAYGGFGPGVMNVGQSHELTISTGHENNYATIWIDFNQDLDFTEDEKIIDNFLMENAGEQYTVTFELANTITPYMGTHLLRARTNYNAPCDDPCAIYEYGETEDYSVILQEDITLPPINIYGNIFGLTVELKWYKPTVNGPEPVSYNVYRDDIFVGNSTTMSYSDEGVEVGTYEYHIKAVYPNGQKSESSDIYNANVEPLQTPVNLIAEIINDDNIQLTWDAPPFNGWVSWDEGYNSIGIGSWQYNTFYTASRWEPLDLLPYEGKVISKISFFPTDNCQITLKVWTGPDAQTEIYSQEVPSVSVNNWNEIDLTSPVPIDSSDELWFGYMVTSSGGSPAGAGLGATPGKGDMINLDGTWAAISTAGWDFDWNLVAYIEDADKSYVSNLLGTPAVYDCNSNISDLSFTETNNQNKGFNNTLSKGQFSYNVYLNDSLIFSQYGNSYIDEGLLYGTYEYCISAVYNSDESECSVPVIVTLTGIDEISDGSVGFFPNPAKDFITIKSSSIIERVCLYNSQGEKVKQFEINKNTETINISDINEGIYILSVISAQSVYNKQIIIRK